MPVSEVHTPETDPPPYGKSWIRPCYSFHRCELDSCTFISRKIWLLSNISSELKKIFEFRREIYLEIHWLGISSMTPALYISSVFWVFIIVKFSWQMDSVLCFTNCLDINDCGTRSWEYYKEMLQNLEHVLLSLIWKIYFLENGEIKIHIHESSDNTHYQKTML